MKRILLIILSAALILGMTIVSLAEEDITQESDPQSGEISVGYNAGVTYTVTIPASVTFTDTEKSVDRPLQVSNVMLHEGSSLKVYVASLNSFKMVNGDGYIDYHMIINTHPAPDENSFNILTVNAGERVGWAILTFVTELDKKNALYAGNYTDTLTFTVSIE